MKQQKLKNENFYLKNVLHNLNQKQRQKNPFVEEAPKACDANADEQLKKKDDAKAFIDYQNGKILSLQVRLEFSCSSCDPRPISFEW